MSKGPLAEKLCPDCGIVKPRGEFRKRSKDSNLIRPYCLVCEPKRRRSNYRLLTSQRNWHFQTTYGISLAERDELSKSQNHQCAICQQPSSELQVDHCHSSNKIRGLLCGPCNRAIGIFKDDPDRLSNAIAYLSGAA